MGAPVRALLAVLSGLALAASFKPYDLPALLPVGVAGFALALHGVRIRRGAWIGLLAGAAFMYVHLFWMRSVGYDAWVLLGTLETVFFVPLGAAVALVSRLRLWPVFTATLWVGVEVWRSSYPFGGMPWGRLAFATADTPYAAALPYVGATGVSLLVALSGTTLNACTPGQITGPCCGSGGPLAPSRSPSSPWLCPSRFPTWCPTPPPPTVR